jgi:hypothetical protein
VNQPVAGKIPVEAIQGRCGTRRLLVGVTTTAAQYVSEQLTAFKVSRNRLVTRVKKSMGRDGFESEIGTGPQDRQPRIFRRSAKGQFQGMEVRGEGESKRCQPFIPNSLPGHGHPSSNLQLHFATAVYVEAVIASFADK